MNRMSLWMLWQNLKFKLQPAVQYIVITKRHPDDLYDTYLTLREFPTAWGPEGDTEKEELLAEPLDYSWDRERSVRVRLPVFELAEVLIVDRRGREIVGKGRKPSKWYVQHETYWTLRAAIKRAQQVLEEDIRTAINDAKENKQ